MIPFAFLFGRSSAAPTFIGVYRLASGAGTAPNGTVMPSGLQVGDIVMMLALPDQNNEYPGLPLYKGNSTGPQVVNYTNITGDTTRKIDINMAPIATADATAAVGSTASKGGNLWCLVYRRARSFAKQPQTGFSKSNNYVGAISIGDKVGSLIGATQRLQISFNPYNFTVWDWFFGPPYADKTQPTTPIAMAELRSQ